MEALGASISSRRTTATVRQRIEVGGERLWQFSDFRDLPFVAVAQALSRLTRQGLLERVSKGIYYHGRATSLGKSRPNPALIQKLASGHASMFPAGITAANLLGFTTQAGRQGELSTSSLSLPRKLLGQDTLIHTRRPEAWGKLSNVNAALLDFLRTGGATSELSPEGTVQRTLSLLAEDGRYETLLKAANTEPPRVRAILGAVGETLGRDPTAIRRLRLSLNPLSRFDFGLLAGLPNARNWQAKQRS